MLLRKGLNTWRSTTAVVSCCLVFCLQECEFWMSQSCLCSRLMFCYMKCYHFPVFPHTASVSLTAGVHVLSYLLFFSLRYCSVILLHPGIILILFLYFRTELRERAHVLSDHQCLHLSLGYRFLTGWWEKKLQISRHSKMGMAVWT